MARGATRSQPWGRPSGCPRQLSRAPPGLFRNRRPGSCFRAERGFLKTIPEVEHETILEMGTADLSPEEKLSLAFELFESGIDIMRQNLRRRYPAEAPDEIEARLEIWLRTRPGAEHGDAAGPPRDPGAL